MRRFFTDLVNIIIGSNLMVRQYCQAVRTDQPPVKNLQIRRAKAWIAANFNQPLTLSKTAMALNLSETYLSALFHEETGQTSVNMSAITAARLPHSFLKAPA